MSSEPGNRTCARCGGPFRCDVDRYPKVPCWCSAVDVAPATLTVLDESYAGCLCPTCLRAFERPT